MTQLDLPLWDPIVYVTNTGTSGTFTMTYGYFGWSRDDARRMFVKRGFGVLSLIGMFALLPTIAWLIGA